MGRTLANIKCVFVYIDDVLIVAKATKLKHLNKVRELFQSLDEANLQLKANNCVIAQECIERLRYKLTRTGISQSKAKS